MKKFDSIVGLAFTQEAVKANPTYKESEEQIMFAVDYGHDNAWLQLEVMDFGDAIKALKRGLVVRRRGWDCLSLVVFK